MSEEGAKLKPTVTEICGAQGVLPHIMGKWEALASDASRLG
jgi:hypothetical protein